ncbi:MAG: hypothetical protein ACRYGA_07140 [Janthinobacterium lividum]
MRKWKWLFACASLILGVSHAGEAKTWSPYGFVTYEDELLNKRWNPLRPLGAQSFSTTPEGACAAYQTPKRSYCAPTGISDSGYKELGWCTENTHKSWACTERDFSANIEENNTVAVFPACFPYPLTVDVRLTNAVGWIVADSTGLSCHCQVYPGIDPADAVPYLGSDVCVSPHRLSLAASRDRFSVSQANEPIAVRVAIERTDQTPAVNEPVTLIVQSASGVPGTLSTREGKTDSSGILTTEYRFPQFTGKQVDKITARCKNCDPESATVELKMAPVVIGFFNGVWNTESQAKDGSEKLAQLMGPTYRSSPIRYENFYNQTGKGTSGTMFQDLAETFSQRSQELDGVLNDRWEHYWDLIAGRHGDPNSLTGSLISGLGSGGLALARLIDATFNATLGQIVAGWARMLSTPPTSADLTAQLSKLRTIADEGSDFVLVAHSQGNLFANAAFDGLRSSHPDTHSRTVHVAPASPSLRGDYGLSSFDLVINGLRAQGITSVQTANWTIPFGLTDASGHAFNETYLDPAREGRAKVKALVDSALASL